MNWYGFLKYAASPKNIINNWKVDDPFLKFFIYTYEPLIDLSKIKSKDDLEMHIQAELLPSLKEKINRESSDSNYKKTLTDQEVLDELDAHPNDPEIQRAKEVFLANPKAGKEVLLNAINDDKQLGFNGWWDHMFKNYSNEPAFIYSVLNPIIDSSPAIQKNPVPPAHSGAIAQINDEIKNKGVTSMNVFKKIKKLSFKLDKGTESESEDEWIRVDSKQRDPENYKANLEKLMRFATGSGWCIAQNSMASQYLSKGDFWLYFQNSKPKVAIRLVNGNKVAEIRGLHNKQEKLNPYWEPVIEFLGKTDFDYQNNEQYKGIQKVMIANADLRDNPAAYKALIDAIKKDPKQYGLVSEENKTNFPELGRTAAIGYEKRMNILLDAVENIPTTGNEYQKRFSQFQDEFDEIPADIRPYMSDNAKNRLVTVHKSAFLRNPLEYEFFPEDMKAAITPEEHKTAWVNYVGNDPYRYNDTRIPMEIRKDIPIRPIVEGWTRLVDLNINHADNIPSYILQFLPENFVENKIIEDFKRYPANRDKSGFDKLERVREKGLMTEEQIAQTYLDIVRGNPNIFRYIPPQYQDHVKSNLQDIGGIAQKNLNEVMADASYFNAIMEPEIRNYLLTNHTAELVASFVKLKQRYGDDMNSYWKSVPEELQPSMPDYIKEEVANFFLPYVQKNPAYLSKVSPVLQPFITNKLSSNNNWYKKLRA